MSPKKPTSSEEDAGERAASRSSQPFVYRPAPGWSAANSEDAVSLGSVAGFASAAVTGGNPVSAERPDAGTSLTENERHATETRAREAGFREGLERARAENEAGAEREKEAIAEALREFVRERNGYFHQVEGEVVALALAIVRKILRREAQVDPLLLSGLVRVALEKIAVSKNVRLLVHPSQIPVWQDFLKQASNLPIVPELMGDATLEQDQCHIDAEHGSTDLNLDTQLKEIEQGLFDLLARRPAPR